MHTRRTLNVLILDSHCTVQAGLRSVLGKIGGAFLTVEASTCGAAMVHLRAAQFDLIVLELDLPDRSGLDVLDALIPEAGAAPIMVLSADDDFTRRRGAQARGVAAFLSKRASMGDIEQAIMELVLARRHLPHADQAVCEYAVR